MDLGLKNKVALVAAASRGLGRAVAEELAVEGAQLVICSRGEEELKGATAEIGEGLPARVEWMTADLADRNEAQRVADEALKRFGRVDVLVNNAGGNQPQRVDQITDEAWDRTGEASGRPFTVRSLAYIIAGHLLHHEAVLKERYF